MQHVKLIHISARACTLALALSLVACRGSQDIAVATPLQANTARSGTACPLVPRASAHSDRTDALDCGCDGVRASPSLTVLSQVAMQCSANTRTMTSNNIPDHAVGVFPNAGNPNRIRAQQVRFSISLTPSQNARSTWTPVPGYLRNGVKLEPETNETYGNQGTWRYEAIQAQYNLGLDQNLAHVQPTGAYHYHGIPNDYLKLLGKGQAMTLVGWAADGFPIYARYGYVQAMDATSGVKVMRPNYRLKTASEIDASRPGTHLSERRGPQTVSSLPYGIFVADWIFDAQLGGDLDACNGRFGATPEFPQGIYHYYMTDAYPYIQRCVWGNTLHDPSQRMPPPMPPRISP